MPAGLSRVERPVHIGLALTLASLLLVGCCPALPGRVTPRGALGYEMHVKALREEAPPGFVVVVARPFVVVGQGTRSAVVADAEEVVERGAKFLMAEYFPREPRDLVTIWMFDGEESYRHHVNVLFGGFPPSPYGFYDPCDDAIAADISLGYGTLIHEMVHAFMAANFPGCPAWFNEGLASLYEHTEEREGGLHGRVNWRLSGLQRSIRARRAPRIEELVETSSWSFYGNAGTNYAVARYLLYYLQENGKLREYYRRFHAARETDPSGYRSLVETLGEKDMADFQRRWEAFVLSLEEPG